MDREHGSLWWIRPRDRSEPVVAVWDGGEGSAPAGWRVAGVVQEYVAMGLSDVLGPVLGWDDFHQALLAMKMTKRRLEAAISIMEEGFQGLVEAPDLPAAAKTAVPGVSNETVGIGGDPDGGGGGSGVTLTAGSGPEKQDEKGKEVRKDGSWWWVVDVSVAGDTPEPAFWKGGAWWSYSRDGSCPEERYRVVAPLLGPGAAGLVGEMESEIRVCIVRGIDFGGACPSCLALPGRGHRKPCRLFDLAEAASALLNP